MPQHEILRINRVIMNNWGSAETTEIIRLHGQSNAVLADTGVGKTTIVDAMQTVLYGSCDSRNYNTAQKDKGANDVNRTCLQYLRGATKHYGLLRDSVAFRANVVIEWYNEKERMFLCTGFIAEVKAGETKTIPPHEWFIVKGRAPENNFRNMSYQELHELIEERDREFKLFRTGTCRWYAQDAMYRSDLKAKVYGGIDLDMFVKLQKAAINMQFEKSQTEFIEQFLFPYDTETGLKSMQDLTERAATMRKIKQLLDKKEEQKEELSEIVQIIEQKEKAQRERDLLEETKAYIGMSLLDKLISGDKAKLETIRENGAKAVDKVNALTKEIKELQDKLVARQVELQNQDYARVENKIKEKTSLRPVYAGQAREWKRMQEKVGKWTQNAVVEELLPSTVLDAIDAFNDNPDTKAVDTLRELLMQKAEDIRTEGKDAREQLRELEKNKRALEEELFAYTEDKRRYPNEKMLFKVKSALEHDLRSRFNRPVKVSVFSRTFDVTDSEWKNAIEGRLNTKSSLIVEPKFCDAAMRLLRSKYAGSGVRLIDSKKMIENPVNARPGSLYDFVSKEDEYIDKSLQYYLGNIMYCDTEEELRESGNGVTKDCFSYSNRQAGPISEKHYTTYASIGKEIPKSVIENIRDEIALVSKEVEESLAYVSALTNASTYETLKDQDTEYILGLAEAAEKLRALDDEIDELQKEAERLHSGDVQEIEQEISRLGQEINEKTLANDQAKIERQDAVKNERDTLQTIEGYEKQLKERQERWQQVSDQAKSAGDAWMAKNRQVQLLTTMEDRFKEEKDIKQGELERITQRLIDMKNDYLKRRPHAPYDDSDACNAKIVEDCRKLTAECANDFRPRYEKAHEEAVESMRNNVITELNRQIQTARLQKLEINRMLAKHPFGNSVYMLELSAADGEMGEFYRMLTAEELELHPDLDSDQHSMMEMMFRANYADTIERFMKIFTPPSEEDYPPEYRDRFADDMKKYEKNLQKYSDYRKYIRFELKERRAGDSTGVMRSVQKTAGLDSGGEKENAKYVAILTGFMMLYQHEEGRQVTPGLIIMDEAFRKMGKKRIHDIVYYAKQMGLQSVLFAPNVLECMGELADTVNTLFAGENERTIVVFTGEAELNELYDRQEEMAS